MPEDPAPTPAEPLKKGKGKARTRIATALASHKLSSGWRLEELEAAPLAKRPEAVSSRGKRVARGLEVRLAKWALVSLGEDWEKLR